MLKMDTPEYGFVCTFYRLLVLPGVPLFVAISGALLLSEAPQPLPVFFRKRLSRVLLPFLLWASAVYVVGVVAHQYPDIHTAQDALACYVPYLLGNRINLSHWFVWMILALYLLTPLLQRALHTADGRHIAAYSILTIFALLVLKHFYPSLYLLYYTSPLLTNLAFYILGFYLAPYINRCAMSRLPLEAPGTKIAVALSRYSYMIYLIHIPLLRAIIIAFHPTPTAYMPVVLSTAVLLVSATVCYLCDRFLPRSFARAIGLA